LSGEGKAVGVSAADGVSLCTTAGAVLSVGAGLFSFESILPPLNKNTAVIIAADTATAAIALTFLRMVTYRLSYSSVLIFYPFSALDT
jgi:hypothetical protein